MDIYIIIYVLSTKDAWIIRITNRNTEEQLRYGLLDHAYDQIIIDIPDSTIQKLSLYIYTVGRSSIFEYGDTDLEAKEESHKTKWPAATEEGEDGPNNPCVGGR